MLCEYGCGREAKFPPVKGKLKWSCESTYRKCPALRKKYSNSGEKNGMFGKKQHLETIEKISKKALESYKNNSRQKRENYVPYNKGKTLIELHGEEKARDRFHCKYIGRCFLALHRTADSPSRQFFHKDANEFCKILGWYLL